MAGPGGDAQREEERTGPAGRIINSDLIRSLPGGRQLASQAVATAQAVLGGLANAFIILFIGAYSAIDPGIYRRSVLALVTRSRRERVGEVLDATGHALRSWLLGQFFMMCVVGVLTTVGLLVLGVPLALTLGLIAFLFSFVPFIGPFAAFVPAALVALTVSPQMVLYVALLYQGVQFVESYFITPIIQQRVTDVPPAGLLFFQVVLGTVFGLLGVALAAPLTVAGIVLVQMLYVNDALGDDVAPLGAHSLGGLDDIDDGKSDGPGGGSGGGETGGAPAEPPPVSGR